MKLSKKVFELLLSQYQLCLEISMKFTDFIFDCVHLFYYNYDQNKSKS